MVMFLNSGENIKKKEVSAINKKFATYLGKKEEKDVYKEIVNAPDPRQKIIAKIFPKANKSA